MDVSLLVVDGLFDSGLTSVLDVLGTANALRGQGAGGPTPFTTTIVGLRRQVRTGHGLAVRTVPWNGLHSAPDLLVLPAIGVKTPEQVIETVGKRSNQAVLKIVRTARETGVALAEAAAAASGSPSPTTSKPNASNELLTPTSTPNAFNPQTPPRTERIAL